ncbi:MAG: hypothetical protein ACOY0T_35190 [Myxococcota bacterium]
MNQHSNSSVYAATASFPRRLRWLLGVSLGCAGAALCPPAQAQETKPDESVQACSAAFEEAQRLRNETKYIAANQEVLKCATPKCGDALFQECTKIYTELQNAMPTVVFGARDGNKGIEVFDVQVSVDGQSLVDQLDGKAIPVDPGNHTFKFSNPRFPAVERQVVIRAGEKFRQLSVMFGGTEPAPTPAAATQTSAATPTPPAEQPAKIPVASWVLGGIGVVGLGGFVAFRMIGSSEYDQLKRECAPDCFDSDVDRVKAKYTLSYISLGVGAAAFMGAAAIYFAQPKEGGPAPTAFVVAPTRDGAGAALLGRF